MNDGPLIYEVKYTVIRCEDYGKDGWECKYHSSEKYIYGDDSGFDHYCNHPNFKEPKFNPCEHKSPTWCPYLSGEL